MPIRLSGIASNMDTDAIVRELMNAQSLKKTKIDNKLTKLQWTKDIWKDMNSKIYKFYTGPLSKLKTQGSYTTKKAVSSNESKVTVKAGAGAATGSYKIKVNELASAQYVTSKKLDSSLDLGSGNMLPSIEVKGDTKLTELGFTVEAEKETVIEIKGKTTASLYITKNTTLNDFVQAAKNAGLNASYDATQKRLFLSSKESGKENTFEITSKTVGISEQRNALRDILGYHNTSGAARIDMDKAIDEYLKYKDSTAGTANHKVFQAAEKKIKEYAGNKLISDLSKFYYDKTGGTDQDNTSSKLNEFYKEASLKSIFGDDITVGKLLEQANEGVAEENKILSGKEAADKAEAKVVSEFNDTMVEEEKQKAIKEAREAAIEKERNKFAAFYQKQQKELVTQYPNVSEALKESPYFKVLDSVFDKTNGILAKDSAPGEIAVGAINTDGLNRLGIGTVTKDVNGSYKSDFGINVVNAQDSEIEYNGATLGASSNVITVNGVTFELHSVTEGSETISLTVSNDVDAVYDMVRSFVKGYNELLQEMNTLYNATSSRGYNPLTDDEKEAMTDGQIEKWEQKIKDSLLRRDDKLSGILSSMRMNMSGSVMVNGKSLSLSSFGIVTGDYTEKGLLHVAGDSDDPLYAGISDKLKKALEENPDEVMQVLSKLTDGLYQDISGKMRSTSLSSALTIYNDKEMTQLETRYKKDLATLEKKLKEMENRYYKQFSAMESAMSKLNSQSSQLSSMLGL